MSAGRAGAAALGAALSAEGAEERRLAAARLRELAAVQAAPLLLRALGDEDWRVRKEAALAGRDLLEVAAERGDAAGEEAVVAALLEALEPGDNVGLRNAAIDVLANHGRGATAALADAMTRLDADGRKLAVEALGRTRDATALGALEAALADPDDNVRYAAMEAIGSLGPIAPAQVAAVLTSALGAGDRFARLTALHGLNALEAAVPWRLLAPLMDDPMLRPAALAAAALAESPEAPVALVRALPSARGGAYTQIVCALSRLAGGPLSAHVAAALREGGPEVAARLVRSASSPPRSEGASGSDPASLRVPGSDPLGLRSSALILSAFAGAPGAIEAAIDALAHPVLAEPAQRALVSLGEQALPAVLARLGALAAVPDLEPEQGAALIDVAVAIEATDPRRVAELRNAMRAAARSPSTLIATTALYALARLGLEEDLQLLAQQTSSAPLPAARVAERTLSALAERCPSAARVLARQMMQTPSLYLPAAIVLEVVPRPLTPEELAFLAHAAAAGDVRARCAAVGAAVAAQGAASLDLLSAALADEEREVQLAAARALGRLLAALDPAAAPPSVATRTAELLDLLRRSGDAELQAAAAPGPAAAGKAEG